MMSLALQKIHDFFDVKDFSFFFNQISTMEGLHVAPEPRVADPCPTPFQSLFISMYKWYKHFYGICVL